MNIMNRWLQRLYFLTFVAVLFTTVFSWLNLNSIFIISLVVLRLLYQPVTSIKAAFANKLFLAYFAFFLVEAAGLLHTHNTGAETNIIFKDSTLIAIAFVFCAGSFTGGRDEVRLVSVYILIVFLASVYCLAIAFGHYVHNGDPTVFFYHSLTRPISQNAIFYSVFVLFGQIFLLSPNGGLLAGLPAGGLRKALRAFLIVFFLLMIVLLNSKLILVITLIVLALSFTRKFSFRKNKWPVITAAVVVLLLLGAFILTDNPIRRRYQELTYANLNLIKREKFSPELYFNAIELRLLEWRFAKEILNEKHAWLFGVSPGDSQNLLDNKYITTNMYIGNPDEGPHRKVRGFIGYNFHNQYLETLVRDGWIGLFVLVVLFGLLIRQAVRLRTPEPFYIVSTLILLFIPEAPLTMQHGIFLFCFFPLLAPYGRLLPAPYGRKITE